MKYYLIAGEASGDLHGSKLMRGLKGSDPEPEFRFFGGDLMSAEGGTLVQHYRQTAVMGLFKVISNLGRISGNLRRCKRSIREFAPDALILIDYSGFNLRIARWAKPAGYRVIYYISPKVWVWNAKRVRTIKENVDRMFVILPFEMDFYRKYDYPVEYVGNPVLDAVAERAAIPEPREAFLGRNRLEDRPLVALLAGSRKQEIRHCLPEMLAVTGGFPGYRFVVAGAPGIPPEYYEGYMGNSDVSIVFDQTYELLMQAEAAVVTSGTATLETALFGVPEAVIYKMGRLTYFIGRQFIKPKFFSLVNLILGRESVREILQTNVRDRVSDELHRILEDDAYRERMLEDFRELRSMLGETGAHLRLASRIREYLEKDNAGN
jgi:lipid-A-disaccharide synthase